MNQERPSVTLIDRKGTRLVLDEKRILLLAEPYKRQLRNLIGLALEAHKLQSLFGLVRDYVRHPLAIAKAKFLDRLLGFDFLEVELKHDSAVFTFHLQERELLWEVYSLFDTIVQKDQYNLACENLSDGIVMDIGAHLGMFSVLAAKMGSERVYSFEPVEPTYEMLKKNIEVNHLENAIIPLNKALGDKVGRDYVNYRFEADEGASLDPCEEPGCIRQACEVTTVDEFVKQGIRPNLIKIDVEGYEKKVIHGAENTIRTSRPLLLVSAYHHQSDAQTLPKEILAMRSDYKYRLLERADKVLYFY
jgi:FkbM family methyltransferase